MLDWNDIRCFLAVAREGEAPAAADALGVDLATVAQRIGALETALELQLFERGEGARLTEAGHALLSSVEALEQTTQALKTRASTSRGS